MMSDCGCGAEQAERLERKTLLVLLAINAVMFVLEFALGWLAQSTGLLADSLDMLADASVYAISLYAVGRALAVQVQAARISGYLQVLLGVGVLLDVFRRLLLGSEPQSSVIMVVGAMALLANVSCLLLIAKHRNSGVHMRASWIFSANDVIANVGVMLSGVLVAVTASRYPDLIVGLVVSALVVRGGVRILRDARQTEQASSAR